MAYYKLTGMISERHPFHGYGADAPLVAPAATSGWKDAMGPVLSGLIIGVTTYGTCRTLSVEKSKSLGVGVAIGISTAIGQIAGGWLRKKAADALTPTAAAPATTVPPTQG